MLVFLHGMIGDPAHWDRVRALLPRELRKRSWAPDLDYAREMPEALAAQLAIEIARRAEGPVVLVGNSLGCVLALRLAPLAQALVMTAPPFDYGYEPIRLRRQGVETYVDALYDAPQRIADYARHKAAACAKLSHFLSSVPLLRQMRALKLAAEGFVTDPALARAARQTACVIGAQDFTTPVHGFRNFLVRHAPGARLDVLEGCGHAVPLERPGALAQVITREAAGLAVSA